ncbi:sialidase family protein [Streptacidiphilus rugosus]|uniref:sialidase family protein n=1 Tax=Streptacidiphilus rugosus TaxID=405783 RepID=UPI00068BCB1E|nr:sialidase family protein [Streptacidiphilus rugosus]
MHIRRSASLLATAAAFALLASGTASATHGGGFLGLISPGDPYASCDISHDGPGTNYLSAEDEPSISANPLRPGQVVAVYQQDRWSNGGSRGLGESYSADGVHFRHVAMPFTHCAPGGLDYQRASDGWVSFGPDGTAYASALVFDATTNRNGVAAATSYDGGRTWKHVTKLIDDNDPTVGDDKNAVTADPLHPGVAYQVWDRLVSTDTSFTGPAYLSVTRDGGRTWSKARPFVDTSVTPFTQTIGNVIVVNRHTGELFDFFTSITYTDAAADTVVDSHYAMVTSHDQGRTWSKPVKVTPDTSVPEVDPNAPTDPAKALRAGGGLPNVAIDPVSGELYLAYEGSDFSGGKYDQVQLVHSRDGGRKWSEPVRLSQAPNSPAFTPSITVDAHGTVAVSYYDLRYLQPGNTTTLPGAGWLLSFPRGGEANPVERRITPVFDWLLAPDAGGHMLGDYEAITTDGPFVRPVLVETNAGQPSNIADAFSGLYRAETLRGPAGTPTAAASSPGAVAAAGSGSATATAAHPFAGLPR